MLTLSLGSDQKKAMKKVNVTTSLLALSLVFTPLSVATVVNAQSKVEQQLIVAQAKPANQQTIIVHLQRGTDDLHAAFMALKVANGLQEKGAQVTLLLTQEGVRIADTRQSLDLRWGKDMMTLENLFQKFVLAGGKIKACPLCADAVGLTTNFLRQGVELAQGDQDIPSLIIAADKVVDF